MSPTPTERLPLSARFQAFCLRLSCSSQPKRLLRSRRTAAMLPAPLLRQPPLGSASLSHNPLPNDRYLRRSLELATRLSRRPGRQRSRRRRLQTRCRHRMRSASLRRDAPLARSGAAGRCTQAHAKAFAGATLCGGWIAEVFRRWASIGAVAAVVATAALVSSLASAKPTSKPSTPRQTPAEEIAQKILGELPLPKGAGRGWLRALALPQSSR